MQTVDVALVFAHTIENMQKMCTIVVVSTLPLQATRSALQAPSDDADRAFCDQKEKRSQLIKIMSRKVLFGGLLFGGSTVNPTETNIGAFPSGGETFPGRYVSW